MTPLPPASIDRPVWLHVGTLLDGTCTTPRRDAHVVYDATGIRFVGSDGATPPRESLRAEQTHPDLVAPDVTLLPGLIEAHAHLFLEGGELDLEKRAAHLKRDPVSLLGGARERLERILRHGVIAVRDAGDRDGVGLVLSRLHASGGAARPTMPYVESPGAAIHHRGRYGGFMGDPVELHASAREAVAARVAAGADRIKLIPTGIINFQKGAVTTAPQMAAGEVAALVAAAREFGRQTFAHASGDAGIDCAIEGGVDSVEHGFFIRDDQLAKLRDRNIAWVPTFSPVRAQLDHAARFGWDAVVVAHLRRILDGHAASLRRAHELGVCLVAGSDAGSCGVPHAGGLLRELELMEQAGLPSLAVLNAATGAGAARLRYKENFGRIAVGARSRFILTENDPLRTVANLRRPLTVVFDGAVLASTDDAGGL